MIGRLPHLYESAQSSAAGGGLKLSSPKRRPLPKLALQSLKQWPPYTAAYKSYLGTCSVRAKCAIVAYSPGSTEYLTGEILQTGGQENDY